MKFLSNLVEAIAAVILVPLIIIYKLLGLVVIFTFLASPIILIGYIVWVIAQ